MDASARLRARYQHAALKHVTGERMTNASLRERFGIADQNAAQASRIIKETLAKGLICRKLGSA
jgi:ATP-dependent DNA helicase RecG